MFSTERAHTCALMGHHDAPECIYPDIVRAIAKAYDSGEAHTFRVGDRGAFCVMAARALSEVASTRPERSDVAHAQTGSSHDRRLAAHTIPRRVHAHTAAVCHGAARCLTA